MNIGLIIEESINRILLELEEEGSLSKLQMINRRLKYKHYYMEIPKNEVIEMLRYLGNIREKYISGEDEYDYDDEDDYEGGYGTKIGALKNRYLDFVSDYSKKFTLPSHMASHKAKLLKAYKPKKSVRFAV